MMAAHPDLHLEVEPFASATDDLSLAPSHTLRDTSDESTDERFD